MFCARMLAAGLAVGLLGVIGCFPQQVLETSRSQAGEDPTGSDELPLVGQKTVIGNTDPIPVYGVGLVYNLNGTGSSPPPGEYRARLENAIRKAKGNPKELLDDPSKSTSLVLVSAVIPAGAQEGDKIDVTVALPPGSKTTSLKGGVLYPCDLANYELAGNVRQAMQATGMPLNDVPVASELTPLMGNRMAVAEGPVLVDDMGNGAEVIASTESETESAGLKQGVVWGGARSLIDRPYYFLLADNNPQPRLTLAIAERINTVFHATGDRFNKIAEAKVQGRPLVVANVPAAYRLNHGRFLLVTRQTPLVPIESNSPYRQQLEHDLVRPDSAILAAIKLEALGTDSRQALRVGLQSESPWVRFAAAESLAYLGFPDGVKELADLAEHHPALRTHCLTALASLDDGASIDLLVNMMNHDDVQLRYGAFVALRSAEPRHSAVRGRLMNNSFWLHEIEPDPSSGTKAAPLVHVAKTRRSEIAIFGSRSLIMGPVSIPLGKSFTVTSKGDGAVTVTRLTFREGEPVAVPMTVRSDLASVLDVLSKLGGTYSDAVELVERLERAEALDSKVAYDAVPRGVSLQSLAQMARTDPLVERANEEVLNQGKPGVVQASYDLPSEAESVKAKPSEAESDLPDLNRNPGRIFGPKRSTEEPGPELNRSPGRIFGAKGK